MKALKIILIVLLVIVGGYFIWMSTIPAEYNVERSTVIEAEPEVVYAYVSDFKTWPEWSAWSEIDPDAEFTYGEISEGAGASYSWQGEIMGKGQQSITAAVPNESMTIHIDLEGMGESDGYWKFEPVEGNKTKVIWGFKGELPLYVRFLKYGIEEQTGPQFETSLENIKANVEAMPKTPEIDIVMTKVEAMPYYGITSDLSWEELNGAFFENTYGEIISYLGEDAQNMTMPTFAIFHKWDEKNQRTTVEPGVAANSKKAGNDRIKKGTTHDGSVLKAVHVGGFDTKDEHEAIYQYTEENNIEMTGSPWEVYVTGPTTEPDTAKWVTEVYYPVVDPADAGEPMEPEGE